LAAPLRDREKPKPTRMNARGVAPYCAASSSICAAATPVIFAAHCGVRDARCCSSLSGTSE
jgi:hypothetical protein